MLRRRRELQQRDERRRHHYTKPYEAVTPRFLDWRESVHQAATGVPSSTTVPHLAQTRAQTILPGEEPRSARSVDPYPRLQLPRRVLEEHRSFLLVSARLAGCQQRVVASGLTPRAPPQPHALNHSPTQRAAGEEEATSEHELNAVGSQMLFQLA